MDIREFYVRRLVDDEYDKIGVGGGNSHYIVNDQDNDLYYMVNNFSVFGGNADSDDTTVDISDTTYDTSSDGHKKLSEILLDIAIILDP